MKITYNQLVEHKACEEQRELFKETFGDEVVITRELCERYYDVFDFEWIVRHLFPSELRNQYLSETKLSLNKFHNSRADFHSRCSINTDPHFIIRDHYNYLKLSNELLRDNAIIFFKLSLETE